MAQRLLRDLRHHDLAVARAALRPGRDQDVLTDAPVVGRDERRRPVDEKMSHDLSVVVLEHLDDGPFATPARVLARHARQHAVAVKCFTHLPRRQEQITAALLRNDEAEAVRMTDDTAVDHVHALRQTVETAAIAQHQPVALHAPQAPLDCLDFARLREFELPRQRLEAQGFTAPRETLEDRRPCRHGDAAVVRGPEFGALRGAGGFN